MKIRKVLVFPAGTEIALEIASALKNCKEVRLFGAGQDIPNHGKFVFPEYHALPSIHDRNWLYALISLCRRLSIDYILPAYDDVIVALSREAERIPAAIVSSPSEACEVTRSKSETYRRLGDIVRVPRVYATIEEIRSFPVFVKPDKGQGSLGVRRVDKLEELNAAIASTSSPIICEFLPGEEYTVDCFSDRDRGVLFARARTRRRVRNGISVNTITTEVENVREIAEKISTRLKLRGAWFFQLKRAENGELALLEIAPRIAGSMSANRVAGVNFPLLSIYEHERQPVDVLLLDSCIEVDRALDNRYRHSISFDTMYVDLDDTLIIDGTVNVQLIALIFQCINQGKRVKLITRHAMNLENTLARFRLTNLFDQVIHLKNGESKAVYITDDSAIFIDDSFAERRDVSTRRRIPTFDCSMIELLVQQTETVVRNSND
jgi:hypothetical protein